MRSASLPRRRALGLIAWGAIATAARAAGPAATGRGRLERPLMGTVFAIEWDHPDPALARRAAERAFATAEEINAVASDYIANSELLEFCRRPHGQPVELSPLLFRLLAEAREIAEASEGCFDPTIGPLTRLWRETRRRGRLPDPEILAAARDAVGWEHLRLDPASRQASLARAGMRLDLGGIAKGQAADAMLATLRQHGVGRALVTAGGDVRAGRPPRDQDAWRVAVRALDEPGAEEILDLADAAVSTSGELHQFVEIDGVRYSHIIDPATGLGLTRPVAATVIAPRATLSDPLATACCTAPAARAREIALAAGASEVRIARAPEG